MSNEDLEKKIEFIVEHQAQFAAQIGQLQERMEQLEGIVARFAQATVDRFQLTDKKIDELEERISVLVDAQIHMEENVKQTSENVKQTDESLRNLIAVVDRYFTEGRNGRSEA